MNKKALLIAAVVVSVGSAIDLSGQTAQGRSRAEVEAQREQARFRAMDVNNDGVLTRREWTGNARAFDRYDTNHDGVLSGSEVWIPSRMTEDASDVQRQTRAYQVGHERGLLEGRQAGKEDKQGPNKWDLEGQRELEQADSGYTTDLGRRDDYQAGYRAGFRLGYRQGFGPRK
jgi:hypothetical protein